MKQTITILLLCLANLANATLYLGLPFDKILERSELIVEGKVIENLPMRDHRNSCAFQVDNVLSGTLSQKIIQVNREYIRMGYPREDYRPGESLVVCLTTSTQSQTRPWPVHSPTTPQYTIIGSDGEGEFPITSTTIMLRQTKSSRVKVVKYAGQQYHYLVVPLSVFHSLISKIKTKPTTQWPDINAYLEKANP